ncbi:copper chaperone [Sulfurimonas sp. CVO]|uniref:Heavy-metal-associated domain-containing protein n=1 Tax=Sulfurimonas xiamenensis TaxID=2590021 RepID=A0AAJ4DMC5_9BACT|nr:MULTISPECIES: heavy-metal-associated domain-containing protein [Sulfurimonas]PLY15267.1 MAG: heavy metal transporter [Sulfurimonas sp.]QFR43028.1 heavy-metal-associated domain-containing protein [Sulfurimonas xiamenensis]QHG91430.1 copper chaperone [Sulfurimonas sp. CVO]
MKKNFKALNIKCSGCANTIKESLKDEFGEVKVDLTQEPRVVTLEIKDEEAELSFRKKMRSLGYPLEDEDLGTLRKSGLKAKSFISCAIGKINKG